MTEAAPSPMLRGLLRDTALEISLLSTRSEARDIEDLRQRCLSFVVALEEKLTERGVSPSVQNEILYAQCALLDEVALKHLSDEQRADWDSEPLQVVKFSDHDAGNKVFENLSARMREPIPDVDLLIGYRSILGLGFRGRYALEGEEHRLAVIKRLDELITKHRPAAEPDLVIRSDYSKSTFRRLWARLSPWAVAACACVLAIILYLTLSGSLAMQVARLTASGT